MKIDEVLLVEDDQDHAQLIQMALLGHDPPIRIRHVETGERAMDVINEYLADEGRMAPKLFLLDVKLPGISGIEVLKKIKGEPRLRAVPAVMLTTSRSPLDIERAYDANANSYVMKPMSFEQIESTMSQLRRYWIGLNVSLT